MFRFLLVTLAFRLKFLRRLLPERLAAWVKRRIVFAPPPKAPVGDAQAWRLALSASQDEGVNIIGYLHSEAGLGQSARICAAAADAAGIAHALVDLSRFSPSRAQDFTVQGKVSNRNPHPFNIFHINADQMPIAYNYLGEAFFAGRYNIGYWAWELPVFPAEWLASYAYVHEVWAPSQFVVDALAPTAARPVLRVPHAIGFTPSTGASRRQFGLPEDRFLFLAMYDMFSYQARKNPDAAVRAFAQAFPAASPAALVLKVLNPDRRSPQYAALRGLIAEVPNVLLIEQTLSRQEVYDLESVCDCFVSLHRSEGFGLALAESMHAGKPVIGTNWSGNVDFMNAENSCPVDYALVELTEDHGPYKRGQVWAEPDVGHAAWYMRKLVDDPAFCRQIAAAARATIARDYSFDAVGRLYQRRLAAIRGGADARAA